MLQTYEAHIKNNQIFWANDIPLIDDCDVAITIYPSKKTLPQFTEKPNQKVAIMAAAKNITAFNNIDGVAYQRALRAEWS